MTERRRDEIAHGVCPLCAGGIAPLFGKGVYRIDRCRACRFAFVNPTPSEAFINDFYDEPAFSLKEAAAAAHERLSRPRASPGKLWDWTKGGQGRRFLDVGCGDGRGTAKARSLGFETTSIEPGANSRSIARQVLGDTPKAVCFEDFEEHGFDALLMNQVLEHARQPGLWLDKAQSVLNPGGIAMIALPNFDALVTKALKARDPYVIPPAHLNYFGPVALTKALANRGFEVLHVETTAWIPPDTFTRRLGAMGRPVRRIYDAVTPMIDAFRAGMILRVVAKRL